jgi:hypothetical protein
MMHALAYAEQADLSGSAWTIILLALAVIAAAAVLSLVPIGLARRRGNPWTGNLAVGALLWGLIAAGSVIYSLWIQANWKQEWLRRIATGYLDPRDPTGQPAQPWWLWIALAAAYALLVAAAVARRGADGRAAGTPPNP